MALEAVVFPQELFRLSMVGGPWLYDMGEVEGEGSGVAVMECEAGDGSFTNSGAEKSPEQGWGEFDGLNDGCNRDPSSPSLVRGFEERDVNSSPREGWAAMPGGFPTTVAAAASGRRKRQRARRSRNREEVENQRMTHIAVERNRRRQMNEYLAALRSLMPPSYVQRGDQASIVGGAINFVKELEQLLQSLEARKRTKQQHSNGAITEGGLSSPFAGFFTFPQYSSSSASKASATTSPSSPPCPATDCAAAATEDRAAVADVEVTMVESHASLKVLSRRRPRQLLGMVVGLQGLRLTTLHLNVTTVGELVLYSFSLKVEDDCQLSSVNEIATAVHQMMADIQGDPPSPCNLQPSRPYSSPTPFAIV